MNFKERMAKRVAEEFKILNEDLIVKNNTDELKDLVLHIVSNIPIKVEADKGKKKTKITKKPEEKKYDFISKISYVGHRVYVPTEEEKCRDHLKDLYMKKGKTNVYYINQNEEHVIALSIDVMFGASMFRSTYQSSLIANTRDILKEKIANGYEINMDDIAIQKILESTDVALSKDDNYRENLLYTIKMYIPLNRYGYYMLGGKYYNGYFLKQKYSFTSKGKLQMNNGPFISYIRNDGNMIKHDVFKESVNPFIYEGLKFSEANLREIYEEEISSEDFDILLNTYNNYLRLLEDDEELDRIKSFKWYNDIDVELIREHIKIFFNEKGSNSVEDCRISKYTMLLSGSNKNLFIEIRKYIPKYFNNIPTVTRAKWNPHPYTLITLIKTKTRQFPLHDKVNEHDIFMQLMYTKTQKKSVSEEERKFYIEEMGLFDPIGSPSTKNVGLSGNVVPCMETNRIVKK